MPQWWDWFDTPASPHKPRFEKVKKRKTKRGQRHHRRWKHWLDSAKEKTCTPAVAAVLTQTCQTLQLLSENRFFLQVSQQGLILSTSNSDASCDESLMWENWKTIIWTWQFSLAGQSRHSSRSEPSLSYSISCKLSPSLHVPLVMRGIDPLIAKSMHPAPYRERAKDNLYRMWPPSLADCSVLLWIPVLISKEHVSWPDKLAASN